MNASHIVNFQPHTKAKNKLQFPHGPLKLSEKDLSAPQPRRMQNCRFAWNKYLVTQWWKKLEILPMAQQMCFLAKVFSTNFCPKIGDGSWRCKQPVLLCRKSTNREREAE